VESELEPIQICHCVQCHKAQGGPFSAVIPVAVSAFQLLGGEEFLQAYESSPGKRRLFCSVCGCHIVAFRDKSPNVLLRAATLDVDPGIRPQRHIWRSHDVPWLVEDGAIPSYPEWPPDK